MREVRIFVLLLGLALFSAGLQITKSSYSISGVSTGGYGLLPNKSCRISGLFPATKSNTTPTREEN